MNNPTRQWVNASVVVLKILAFAAVLQPVLARHASKAVTVFTQPAGPLSPAAHARSYTYFSGFHMLNLSDIKWGLAVGLALYVLALVIQFMAAGRPNAAPTSEGRQAS